jgi:hypothetical protein
VLDAATVLPVDGDRETIRAAVREPFDSAVRIVDADTGDLIEGIEFRTVEHDGRLLVAVGNYTDDSVTVAIERDGDRVSEVKELLGAERASLPATLERRTLRLFAIQQ